jgi:hypothetical protein
MLESRLAKDEKAIAKFNEIEADYKAFCDWASVGLLYGEYDYPFYFPWFTALLSYHEISQALADCPNSR